MSEESPKPETTSKIASKTAKHGGSGLRWLTTAVFLFGLLAPCLVVGMIFMAGPLQKETTVVIPHGAGLREIAGMLDQNGVTVNSWLFRVAARVLANDALKAGEYDFRPGQSMADVVDEIHEGRSVIRNFTAAEGLTSAEIVAMLDDVPLSGKVAEIPHEGSMLPETYRYSYGDTRIGMVARMQKKMREVVETAWPKRDMSLPLKSPEEALVMASIIEKETAKADERARIARVFYNRIQQGMKLQSDPTVIYSLTQGKQPLSRSLTHADMSYVSPYNTYLNDGLPPGPICNPGRASIEAALHPEGNDFLFFVADGTGGHVFAKDLVAHNQNVSKWANSRRVQSVSGGAKQN